MAVSACLALAFSAVGCEKKTVANDENTLEIFICNFGYGTDWLYAEVEEFKKADWVTAKYPDLNVVVDKPIADQAMANSKIMSGKEGNTADLLFTCSETGNVYYESGLYLDLTSLYDTTIPGESVKVKDKMNQNKYTERLYTTDSGEEVIYSFPWVNGFSGMFINVTAANSILGEDYLMPRTTQELAQMCTDIKESSTNTKGVKPFISCSTYYQSMFNIWWAQYEGVEEYSNFFYGIADGEMSNKIFEQTGRLRALQELESIMGYESGNVDSMSTEMEFMQLQANFFNGNGVMMPNGDWLENEMKAISSGEITILKNPVISTIVETLSVVKADEELAFVVQCVDEHKDYETTKAAFNEQFTKELPQSDYERIYEARNVLFAWGGHEAYIPSYSVASELAKDFLLFMATDKGVETFMKATMGCQTAFTYDVETKNPTLYDSLSRLQKDHVEINKTGIMLLDRAQTRLCALGGLKALQQTNLQSKFLNVNAAARETAQQIFDYDIEYYSTANGRFEIMLKQAGLKG